MKKLLLAAVASAFVATPALAQSTPGPATSIDIPLSGTLAKRCTLSANLNGPFHVLNLESTEKQGGESLSGDCNYSGTATVALSSLNGGNLKSGTNLVPYKLQFSGLGADWDAGKSLAGGQTISNFVVDGTRTMSVKLDNIATVAGTYTDVITAAITPN
jgi:hypothetical protein